MPLLEPFKRLLRLTEARQGIVVPLHGVGFGERPPVDFRALRDYYLSDPDVKDAVDDFVDMVVGPGFYVTGDVPRAADVVDEFNEGVNMDGLFRYVTTELTYSGNSFVELLEPDNIQKLEPIELTTIQRIKRDKFGEVGFYVQVVGGQENKLDPKRIIHFAWNVVDRQPYGVGLLSPLAARRIDPEGDDIPSILDMKLQMLNDMRKALHAYGNSKIIFHFEGVGDEFIVKQAEKIKESSPESFFATNRKVNVQEAGLTSRSTFDKYIDFIESEVIIGLQSPSKKLKTTPGYTEASARAVLEMYERRVKAFQRYLKREVEKIYIRVLDQEGLNASKAKVRLNWGQPDLPEMTFADYVNLFQTGAVRRDEFRKILRDDFGLELAEDLPTPDHPAEPSKPMEVTA